MTIFRFLFVTVLLFFSHAAIHSAEPGYLKQDDIDKIMKQIFEKHVDKKEMTASILKKAFKVYLDQFDPHRIYLLEEEVRPYLNPDDTSLVKDMSEYQKRQYSEFEQLNNTVQKAITRARQLRAAIESSNLSELFESSSQVAADGNDDWTDPDLKVTFASNEEELSKRIKYALLQFIAEERRRFGSGYIAGRQPQIIRLYEKQTRAHENQYLYIAADEQPMSASEKENAFALHVLKALASSLDAHTSVLNPTEAYDMRIRLEKEIEGIGLGLDSTHDGFLVTHFLQDSPAAKSGLIHVNDILIEVDGTPLAGKTLGQVMEMLRGKNGTKVNLVFQRKMPGTDTAGTTFPVSLVRSEIAINEDRARWSYEKFDNGIIGKIQLDSFYQGDTGVTSENDVRDAITKLNKIGNLRGLILDLRENSGGFLSQAVKVAGLFITNGVIVISKYFNGEEHFYRDMDGKVSYDGPLIVLTSKATASAAEIVAQALQDYGVAVVVGDEHTYGKGTIQSQTITEDKASTFFKVTVGKYYTVSGKTPQMQGVKADVVVPSQFLHENMGEEYLDYPLKQDVIAPAYKDDLEDITPNLKPWYLRYYAPTLQDKKELWQAVIPILKKNSAERMSKNQAYQAFLKGSTLPNRRDGVRPDDLQVSEAAEVLKDMITLQAKMRGNENDLRGSAAQTAGVIKPSSQEK